MSSVVPDGWEVSKLEDRLYRPLAYGVLKPDAFVEDGVPMLRIQDVSISGLNKRKLHRISEKLHLEFKRTQLREGDLVISLVGTIGRVLEITKSLDGANVSRAFGVIGLKDDIDRHYIRQFLTSQKIQDWIQEQAQGNAQKVLNLGELRNLSIVHPPLPEQKKIASILTSVDEVIENTQKQIDKLQDLKKATMNELLTKGIGHTEFKDSELGRIPKSWEVIELSSLVNSTRPITYGIVQTGEHIPYGIPCVRVVDIVQGKPILERMIRTTQQINDSYSRTVLQENDIMFALRGNIGFVRKVQSFLRGANLTRGIALISNSEEITSDYLLYALQSQVVRRQIADGVNGSALQEIPLGNLRTVRVPVPCKTEQTGISKVIASLDKLIETSLLKLSQTQSLKKSLMQDLLTGKVRVTVN